MKYHQASRAGPDGFWPSAAKSGRTRQIPKYFPPRQYARCPFEQIGHGA